MDENRKLLELAREGDFQARERLVEENIGLVWSVAKRFIGRGYELEDIFQIGSIGLIKAIDHFDLSFDVKFSTYAVPIITGEIKRFLRDDGMIKVSRSLKELSLRARLATERLGTSLGREPTLQELSQDIGVEAEELAAALESGAEVESLSRTIYQSDGNDISLMDKLEDGHNHEEEVLNRLTLHSLLEQLQPEERQVIWMRYFQDCTQTQVANRLGVSQVQISRMEKRVLQRMRDMCR